MVAVEADKLCLRVWTFFFSTYFIPSAASVDPTQKTKPTEGRIG